MTGTRHTQPLSLGPGAVLPVNAETIQRLVAELVEARAKLAGNPAPTIEDVDAELQPKGLPVISLDLPAWIGEWTVDDRFRERQLLHPDSTLSGVMMLRCTVQLRSRAWHYNAPFTRAQPCPSKGHPTPEAAQAACEAAIIAAWRNR